MSAAPGHENPELGLPARYLFRRPHHRQRGVSLVHLAVARRRVDLFDRRREPCHFAAVSEPYWRPEQTTSAPHEVCWIVA